jgi:two-component system sensor histidine kinase DesK
VHDVLGYLLSAITLKGELAAAMVGVRPDDAARELAEMVALARSGHREIRDVVSGYRSVSLEQELAGVTAVLSSTGMRCDVDADDLDGLPVEASVPLAYALREGATNVLRHSVATWCHITLRRQDGGVALRMANDGVRATAPDPSSNGLSGLRERLLAVDGSLVAGPQRDGSQPDGAYELLVHIPLRERQLSDAVLVEAG